ncbi:guanylate kinase-like isoform X2 [Artemia franciscana]
MGKFSFLKEELHLFYLITHLKVIMEIKFSNFFARFSAVSSLEFPEFVPQLNMSFSKLFLKFLPRRGGRRRGNHPQIIHMETNSMPRPLVFCGPSGAGKSTLIKQMMAEFGDVLGFSVSHTTRAPRTGEVDGKDYYFTTKSEMERSISNGEFIEYAVFSGNMYGTSKMAVEKVQKLGKICVLDIERQGVIQIKKTDLNPHLIFIKPPSMEELKNRLLSRGTETMESLKKRLAAAEEELAFGEIPGNFHKIIVNDNIHEAYNELKEYLLTHIEDARKNGARMNGF